MKSPLRVVVTGAAGNIGYAMLYRLASGEVLGPDQPVILHMLEITPALKSLEGVAMELEDCAFPLLAGLVATDDAEVAFDGVNYALLVGARPRTAGMERKDLLAANGAIFTVQGKALNARAAEDVRILVVGNPANTNCLIARLSAPDIPAERFTAMTRLDHNRAVAQAAKKAGVGVSDVKRMTIWGNHSGTQYPDLFHASISGRPAAEVIGDDEWIKETFIPLVQQRGATVIAARGASSAASAANAALDHVKTWHHGTPVGDWTSMAIASSGQYGAPEGVIFSFPVTVVEGNIVVVGGLALSDFDRERLAATGQELLDEKAAIADLVS